MKCRKISKSLSMHSFEPKMDEVSPTTIFFFEKKSKAFFRATSTHINTTFVTTPSTENDKLSKPSIRDTTVWPSVTNVMSVTVIRWRWLGKNEDSSEIGYLLLNYRDKKNGSIGLSKVKMQGSWFFKAIAWFDFQTLSYKNAIYFDLDSSNN